MPIYEFYCPDCHMLLSFLARASDTRKRPRCPHCARPRLERRVSSFAISKGQPETEGQGDMPDIDDERLGRVMAEMSGEADGVDENDPRQVARMMRRLFDGTGMQLGPGMEEAMRRMEAGEDPDRIEQELGDALEDEGEGLLASAGGGRCGLKALRRRLARPTVDPTLYEM